MNIILQGVCPFNKGETDWFEALEITGGLLLCRILVAKCKWPIFPLRIALESTPIIDILALIWAGSTKVRLARNLQYPTRFVSKLKGH